MARPNRSPRNNVAAFKWCQLKWTISVMFFVFHILVFAYFTRFEINCFSHGTISEGKNYGGKYEEISNLRDAAHVNGSLHRTNQINTNLKSHIFDKLLSEEMLSGIQYDDQEYNTQVPLLQVITKNSLATIILNRNKKTKARIMNKEEIVTSNSVSMRESNALGEARIAKLSMAQLGIQKSVLGNIINNKVVGMRSLTSSLKLYDRVSHESKICTCMKSSLSPSTCSHSCTGSSSATNKKRCTHSTPARVHDCSRPGITNHSCSNSASTTSVTYPPHPPPFIYPAFYMPNTYFITPSQDDDKYQFSYPASYTYSGIKYSRKHKKKHRKTTTRLDDELYYDDVITHENLKRDEDIDYDETVVTKKNKKTREPTVIVNVEYEEARSQKYVDKDSTPSIYNIDHDKLIKEIVKDLNNQHNKVGVKECYCDSSLVIQPNNILVSLFILMYTFSI